MLKFSFSNVMLIYALFPKDDSMCRDSRSLLGGPPKRQTLGDTIRKTASVFPNPKRPCCRSVELDT